MFSSLLAVLATKSQYAIGSRWLLPEIYFVLRQGKRLPKFKTRSTIKPWSIQAAHVGESLVGILMPKDSQIQISRSLLKDALFFGIQNDNNW